MLSAGFAASPFHAIMEADRKPAPTDENSRDILLMERIGAGDHRAFRELVERHQHAIVGTVAKMLGNASEAEDISQQVFLRVWRHAKRYRPDAKFTTYLFTITRNLAINQARRRKRSPVRNITELNLEGVDLSSDPYQVATRATDELEKQEEIAQVLKALDDLPADQKEVIVLGVFQDLSYAEMEQITGTKAVTLRSRMFHGLKRLARLVGGGKDQ